MMNRKKNLLYFLTLILCLSYLLSLDAAALPRRLASWNQGTQVLEVEDQVETRQVPTEERFVEGRMDFESNDYPGSGPNNRHDPRSPGKP